MLSSSLLQNQSTPLLKAIMQGCHDMVSLMLQYGAHINTKDNVRHRLCHICRQSSGVVNVIMVIIFTLQQGYPYLSWAIKFGHHGVVQAILKQNGVDLNITDRVRVNNRLLNKIHYHQSCLISILHDYNFYHYEIIFRVTEI